MNELKAKANNLPFSSGVYLMRDKDHNVIYVGKAKKLKNRVSQYFQDTASHSAKTKLMVSKVCDFDVIVAKTEFEALVLESSLIKQYKPKYNILLKDDKGYPYIRLDHKETYPRISVVNRKGNDGALYYGPFGSRSITQNVLETVLQIMRLPSCTKVFPRDIGKGRPCLHFHMGQCHGWCQDGHSRLEYLEAIEQAKYLLSGRFKQAAEQIRAQMLSASDSLNFELAANLRDRLQAVQALGQRQLVARVSSADTDVIGFAQTESASCIAVLHFSGGDLLDKDFQILHWIDDAEITVAEFLKQYYPNREFAPKNILLPLSFEDRDVIEAYIQHICKTKSRLFVPQRGEKAELVALANTNALEEAKRITDKESKRRNTLRLMERMLQISSACRIESYDISNISGTDIVGAMVVFEEGVPAKKQYKHFKINDLSDQDDYASMAQMLLRRFTRLRNGDPGFEIAPDLLLIDGGILHAKTAQDVLEALELSIPVFGMVKDDRHRTRALVAPDGSTIEIVNQPSVFSLIGNIQEETHNFAIGYHRNLRSKRLRYSELDGIEGVGPKRKQLLLSQFHSIKGIASASLFELERVLPKNVAEAVFHHFAEKRG